MNDSGKPKLVIGADNLGIDLKAAVREHLERQGFAVDDIGVDNRDPVDYPDIGAALARKVADGAYDRGILICGTGAGMAITANKVPGVRAVCVQDPYTAERAVASNNAQIITLGQLITGPAVATMLVDIWLANEFQGGGSAQKVAKMDALDDHYRSAN